MGKAILRTLAFASLLVLSACIRQASWTGWVYPDASALGTSIELGRFDTFEQCRKASLDALAVLGRTEAGTFECGRACRTGGELF